MVKSSKMVPNIFHNDFNTSRTSRSPQVQLTPMLAAKPTRLLMQAIRVKLNVEAAVIPDESNPNHL